MTCPVCGGGVEGSTDTYVNLVCDDCDDRAVNKNGDEPWHGWPPGEEPESEDGTIQMAPDRGENPVFIDGKKCWRRYRFGGWVTMYDEHDCDSLEEFYEAHGMM
ncbi:hypothetical protein [Haloarchaeobius iranensis]|uniref:Uncharacterized protein n=2 Tax=Haloarchaeobius iranensis TaxID=996166 RepID=A0A1H0B751_9EURY|nr:hypothetical protein [Haloarchaeobius iranensis]SDN41382.1 hypothetical protein SAMN05192554_13419 [Haloarchaeobius iranensis]